MASLHGKIAIGILVMQDIFAVIFLAISTGKVPNMWALALIIALPLVRPLMYAVLNRSKHGELLPLFGFFFALVAGYNAFDFAGLKGDLGALIMGMMFAPHKKAGELSKSLLNLKDILLWNWVWTRDIAYAVDLGLAHVGETRERGELHVSISRDDAKRDRCVLTDARRSSKTAASGARIDQMACRRTQRRPCPPGPSRGRRP